MTTKASDTLTKLLRQYGCGPMQFAARPSGTEHIDKSYAESFFSPLEVPLATAMTPPVWRGHNAPAILSTMEIPQ